MQRRWQFALVLAVLLFAWRSTLYRGDLGIWPVRAFMVDGNLYLQAVADFAWTTQSDSIWSDSAFFRFDVCFPFDPENQDEADGNYFSLQTPKHPTASLRLAMPRFHRDRNWGYLDSWTMVLPSWTLVLVIMLSPPAFRWALGHITAIRNDIGFVRIRCWIILIAGTAFWISLGLCICACFFWTIVDAGNGWMFGINAGIIEIVCGDRSISTGSTPLQYGVSAFSWSATIPHSSLTAGPNGSWSAAKFPLWPISIFFGAAWLTFFRRGFARGHCNRCGYNLTGNQSGVCPECGHAVVGV